MQKFREGSRENLERATKIASIQPLIRRIVKAIHRGIVVGEPAIIADQEGNLLERIMEIISAADREDSAKKQKADPLISVIREFLKAYPATPLLTQLYNQASAFALNEKKKAAALLFSLLADVTDTVLPDLCGKSHYKLAILSQNEEETVRHLAKCVLVYPEHRAAADLLNKVKKENKGKKGA
jgi:hypothetical protein